MTYSRHALRLARSSLPITRINFAGKAKRELSVRCVEARYKALMPFSQFGVSHHDLIPEAWHVLRCTTGGVLKAEGNRRLGSARTDDG